MNYRATLPWTVLASLFVCVVGLAACGAEDPAPIPGTGQAGVVVVQSAAQLYQTHCSVCHGDDGDGKGIVVLDRPARSFLKGAFSFGNTPEALFRTISNGIGGTPMPGFKDFLSESERHQLAQYVIDLGPEQILVKPGESEYHVTDRPRIIRGGLPPIGDGLAPMTRGLLVGGVDGLTFEYNAKPLVLLGVRQGAFVDRKDWGDRGGAQLQPLGVVSKLVEGGGATHMWAQQAEDASWKPLGATLIATTVEKETAWVEYGLLPWGAKTSQAAVVIREHGQAVSVAGWPGFRRTFKGQGASAFADLRLTQLKDARVQVEAQGKGGRLMRLIEELKGGETPTFCIEYPVLTEGGESTLRVDTLFGLQPTEENLKGLKELVQ
ncbi:MAG: mono/diheme cytochrome c family protein [Planctomycetota bacterium]|jgi:mono/diheme cytochrome c family protein